MARSHKYIDKVRTKSGKWRYIYERPKHSVYDNPHLATLADSWDDYETYLQARDYAENYAKPSYDSGMNWTVKKKKKVVGAGRNRGRKRNTKKEYSAVTTAQATNQGKQYIAKVLGAVGGSSGSSANRPRNTVRPHKVQHSELYHHGIKGMKWGVRRYQNEDGSLTPEGRKHYRSISSPDKSLLITRGATVGAVGGTASSGIVGGVVGGAAGAAVGYAKYKLQKRSFEDAQNKLKADSERRQKEYENSEEYKKWLGTLENEGKRLNDGGAESFRKYQNKEAIAAFRDIGYHESDWAKERGLKTPEAVNEYVKKALKNYNENDPDQIVYQHMDDAMTMREHGYISEKTFAKLYDAQLAEDAIDFSNYGSIDFLDEWHDFGKSSSLDSSNWKDLGEGRYSPTKKNSKQPSGTYVQVSNKNRGGKSMIRIDSKPDAAISLGYMGYSRPEIAKILGISEEALSKELASYRGKTYNGGIGVGKISRK